MSMNDNGTQGLAPQGTGTEEESQGSEQEYSFGADFLKNVADADKPHVEKYLKDWDSGVGKKFQEIHETYKPYKELGDLNYVKQAVEVAKILETDPAYIIQLLVHEQPDLLKGLIPPPVGDQQNQQTPSTPVTDGNLQGLPKEVQAKLDAQEQLLTQLAQAFITTQQQQQQTQQDKELNAWLEGLHKKHGDFDEDWVMLKVYNGMDADKAVKEFHSKYGKPAVQQANPTLSGGGVIPSETQKISEMSRDDTVAMVTQILKASQST